MRLYAKNAPTVSIFWISFLALIVFNLSALPASAVSQALGGLCLCALWAIVLFQAEEFERSFAIIDRKIGLPLAAMVSMIFFGLLLGSFALDFQGLNGTKWDLAQYIQATRNFALRGEPTFTFMGHDVNYRFTHRSLSLHLLGMLYRVFPSPYIVVLWQPFCFILTSLGMALLYREIRHQEGRHPAALGYLSAILLWIASVVVLRQRVWPSTFHILGPVLLVLAYLGYLKKSPVWALIAIALLPFEKEDYAMIAAPFSLVIATDVLKHKKGLHRSVFTVAAVVVFFLSLYSFFSFWHGDNNVPFDARFGNYGKTANEALRNFFLKPEITIHAILHPVAREYILYFFVASLAFLSVSWETLRFLIPVAPIIFLQSLSNYEPMQLLKDGYALTPAAGALSHALLVSRFSKWRRKVRFRDHAFLATVSVFCLSHFWLSQSASFTFRQKVELVATRSKERALLMELEQDKGLVICCHERLCSVFADRDFLVDARFCENGAPVLDEAVGKRAVFVEYQKPPTDSLLPTPQTQHAFVPTTNRRWAVATDFLKISEPLRVQQALVKILYRKNQ